MDPNQLTLTDWIVTATVVVFGVGKGFSQLQAWGFFPKSNGNGGSLKKCGDLTVESFESKLRDAVRGELKPIALLQAEANTRLEGLNITLVQIRTILEQQSK